MKAMKGIDPRFTFAHDKDSELEISFPGCSIRITAPPTTNAAALREEFGDYEYHCEIIISCDEEMKLSRSLDEDFAKILYINRRDDIIAGRTALPKLEEPYHHCENCNKPMGRQTWICPNCKCCEICCDGVNHPQPIIDEFPTCVACQSMASLCAHCDRCSRCAGEFRNFPTGFCCAACAEFIFRCPAEAIQLQYDSLISSGYYKFRFKMGFVIQDEPSLGTRPMTPEQFFKYMDDLAWDEWGDIVPSLERSVDG